MEVWYDVLFIEYRMCYDGMIMNEYNQNSDSLHQKPCLFGHAFL